MNTPTVFIWSAFSQRENWTVKDMENFAASMTDKTNHDCKLSAEDSCITCEELINE